MMSLPSDSSDGKFQDNEKYEAVNAVKARLSLKQNLLILKMKKLIKKQIPRPFGSEKSMGQSHNKNQPAENADADPLQPIKSKENYIGCWLPHLNMCKVACSNKT